MKGLDLEDFLELTPVTHKLPTESGEYLERMRKRCIQEIRHFSVLCKEPTEGVPIKSPYRVMSPPKSDDPMHPHEAWFKTG